jgi:hypothetical protein
MLIASKYEEIYAPEVRDFVYITDKTYTKEDIIKMEYKILKALNFETLSVYPYTFLQRFHFVTQTDMKSFYLAQFILEYSLLEYKMLEYLPSIRAASSLFVARKLLRIEPSWSKELVSVSSYAERDLKSCSKDLCNILEFVPKLSLKACLVKFSSAKFMEVSKIINSIK